MREIKNMGQSKSTLNSKTRIFHPTLLWSVGLLLLVFAGVLTFVTLKLRSEIRAQIIYRDAEVLYSVTLMDLSSLESRGETSLKSSNPKLSKVLRPLVKTSKLRGVIGLRIFHPDGRFLFKIPNNLMPAKLKNPDVVHISHQKPLSRFHSKVWLDTLFVDPFSELSDSQEPLLEVLIPLHTPKASQIFGIAQYWIDGRSTQEQFDLLDRRLIIEAQMVFWSGSLLIAFILYWAFQKLQKSNRLLEHQTQKLRAANRELTLTAKTSAIGAISAHLIHGIKNPIAGLREFISSQSIPNQDDRQDNNGEWEIAAETTRQIHDLLQELIVLIREEENQNEQYELTMEEICEMVLEKAQVYLKDKDVSLKFEPVPAFTLLNREGNLTRLILDNLIQNAIEASPPSKEVLMRFISQKEGLHVHIMDQGPGLPEHLKDNPFVTCISSKPNGNGIGLAISHHISRYVGAKLSLERSGADGTCFSLFLPPNLQKQFEGKDRRTGKDRRNNPL